jgi:hypothetical protein
MCHIKFLATASLHRAKQTNKQTNKITQNVFNSHSVRQCLINPTGKKEGVALEGDFQSHLKTLVT